MPIFLNLLNSLIHQIFNKWTVLDKREWTSSYGFLFTRLFSRRSLQLRSRFLIKKNFLATALWTQRRDDELLQVDLISQIWLLLLALPGSDKAGRQWCCLCRREDQIRSIPQATGDEQSQARWFPRRHRTTQMAAFYWRRTAGQRAAPAADWVLPDATATNTINLHWLHRLIISSSSSSSWSLIKSWHTQLTQCKKKIKQ